MSSQTVLLNTLTSEFVTIPNPLPDGEGVCGVYLLNAHLYIYGQASWCRFSLRGVPESSGAATENVTKWKMLTMEWVNLEEHRIVFWTGSLDEPAMLIHNITDKGPYAPFHFHR